MIDRVLRCVAAAFVHVLAASAPAQTPCGFAWDTAFGNPGAAGVSGYGATLVNRVYSWNGGGVPGLYVTGSFSSVGGVAASGIARWNGSTWTALGSGLNGPGRAMAAFDEGSGPVLFVGGSFTTAGGVTANGIARWDGTAWNAVGGGMNAAVEDLVVFDDGNGAALYACGWFTQAGGAPASLVARWSGTAWSAVGGGLGGGSFGRCFAVHDAGNGPTLHVGGLFTQPAVSICRFVAGNWVGLVGQPTQWIGSLQSYDDGAGASLFAGSLNAFGVERWDGTGWSPVGSFAGNVTDLIVADMGTGTRLVASNLGTIQSWNGTDWTTPPGVGSSFGYVYDLETHDDGTGAALYAAGTFYSIGATAASRIARWRRPYPVPLCFQPGGAGSAVFLANRGLVPGHAYQNVVSDVLCPGGPNTGPWLGLCAGDPGFLFAQVALPLGAVPFHHQATALSAVFGPFPLPPGLTFELVCFDRTGDVLGCAGPAIRYTVP